MAAEPAGQIDQIVTLTFSVLSNEVQEQLRLAMSASIITRPPISLTWQARVAYSFFIYVTTAGSVEANAAKLGR